MNDRLRIGVWLSSAPRGGGCFQHTLAVLHVLSALQYRWPGRYEPVYFAADKQWKRFMARCRSESGGALTVLNRSLTARMIGRLARMSRVGLRLWRRLNEMLPITYRPIYEKDIDVMLCPAPDVVACELTVPTVSVIHDLMHRYESAFPEVGTMRIVGQRERLFRSMCSFCKVLLVDSQLGKRHVVESYGNVLKAEVVVLPFLPAPYVLNHDPTSDYTSVKTKYDLPEQYIFYPAQFWLHKNHHRLLEAIQSLRRKGVVVYAVFAGAAKNNHARVVQLIEELDLSRQVRLLGYVPDEDIVGLYKNARALVMPTFFGPTNIPTIEAFFLGVPVACSNVYAMPEQVGDAALLFDPRSVADMAEKIEMIWTDASLRSELVRRGHERVKDMSAGDYVEKWRAIIDTALGRTGPLTPGAASSSGPEMCRTRIEPIDQCNGARQSESVRSGERRTSERGGICLRSRTRRDVSERSLGDVEK